jgi:hypothetical protein
MRAPLVTLAFVAVASGCTDVKYLGPDGYYAFAMTDETPAFEETDENAVFIVEERIEFPIREPSGETLARLTQEGEELGLVWPRAPYVERDDYRLELDYLLVNLDDEERRVTVTVNGISEFTEYSPGVVVDEDRIIAEYAGWERLLVLEPLERRSGTVRAEELDEVAADLASVVQPGVTNPNTLVHPDSQSDRDPRAIPFLPPVIPGLVGLKVGLRVEGEAANVVCEVTIRVRDDADRIVGEARAWQMDPPEVFMPSSVTGGVAP